MNQPNPRPVRSLEVLPLRQKLLCPDKSLEELVFPGDELETTAHFGYFENDQLAAIATILNKARDPCETGNHWQLRGMAVEAHLRGRGVGARLMEACFKQAGKNSLVWCNARTPAEGFYVKLGFKTVSDVFNISGAGPHVVMQRSIDS